MNQELKTKKQKSKTQKKIEEQRVLRNWLGKDKAKELIKKKKKTKKKKKQGKKTKRAMKKKKPKNRKSKS